MTDRWWGGEGMGGKGEGVKEHRLVVTECHRDQKYSTGNIVNIL